MKSIEGFQLTYDESTDELILSKVVDGKERFLHIDISIGSNTAWSHLVEDEEEYREHFGEKLRTRIKKSIAKSFNNI
jgi:hypothetical protein